MGVRHGLICEDKRYFRSDCNFFANLSRFFEKEVLQPSVNYDML